MYYQQLIEELDGFIHKRLEHYFGKREEPPAINEFKIKRQKGHPFYNFTEEKNLNREEKLILSIALAPHLNPEFFTNLIRRFLPDGGDLPVFGCARGKHHRGFIPTGETVQFILGGTNADNRIKASSLIEELGLVKNGILAIEQVPDGEPKMSGKITVSAEYTDLFLKGELSSPSFGPDFPAQKIETRREWSDLVLPDNLQVQLEELKTWMLHNEMLMNEWGMRKKIKPGYRVLFYGPTGTGKTLTATLLGKYTGRDVFRVDLSTIVSKYIGETEKNLEKLFSKATNKEWILFFDEADALFGKRTDVSDSHDRYANQEVSYLLQRVENFNGLVILSSNYKSNIDDAFLRRFNAILKFTLPGLKDRRRIWEKSFPENVNFEKNLKFEEIARKYKLTGGNIINVAHRASLQALSQKSETITLQSVLHGIKREVEKEGKIFDNQIKNELNIKGMN